MSRSFQTTPVDAPETAVPAATPIPGPRPTRDPGQPRRREWPLVDALRGVCLVFMGIAHFGGPLAPITWQPLGFVSVAEVFFFLSGFIAGTSCTRVVRRTGGDARPWDVGRRVRRIYVAHLVTVALGAGGLLVATSLTSPAAELRQFWPALFEAPVAAVALAAALLATPPPLDILPLYVAFVLTVPWVVGQCRRGRWKHAIAASLSLWAVSQVTMGRLGHWATRLLPGADPPDFDLLAYQLPFVLGILVGWDVVVRGSADRWRLGAGRLAAVGAAAAMLCVARRVVAEDTFAAQLLVGRPSFGPIRAVNFALLALLALNARVRLARWVRREPLAMLGRQSLYVFSAHAVLVLWLRPWRADLGRVGASVELAATAAFLAAMVGVAWWRERPRGA